MSVAFLCSIVHTQAHIYKCMCLSVCVCVCARGFVCACQCVSVCECLYMMGIWKELICHQLFSAFPVSPYSFVLITRLIPFKGVWKVTYVCVEMCIHESMYAATHIYLLSRFKFLFFPFWPDIFEISTFFLQSQISSRRWQI